MKNRWLSVWTEVADTDGEQEYSAVVSAYGEKHRTYHNLYHIEDCLVRSDLIRTDAAMLTEIELAIWYHDIVYDTRSSGNEERSAERAESDMHRAGVRRPVIENVKRLILATRHDCIPVLQDEKILTDTDLSILGRTHEEFQEYERKIRQEYSWVPEDIFRQKRAEILAGFLKRPCIYLTIPFREKYESAARRNIKNSLAQLRKTVKG